MCNFGMNEVSPIALSRFDHWTMSLLRSMTLHTVASHRRHRPPAQPALLPAYATVAAGLNLFSDKENMLHTTIWQHRYSVYDLRAT